jgi:hypothetical protein
MPQQSCGQDGFLFSRFAQAFCLAKSHPAASVSERSCPSRFVRSLLFFFSCISKRLYR